MPAARFPDLLETSRLAIRPADPGAAARVNTAIRESFVELHRWLPWADHLPTVDETRQYLAEAAARFQRGEDFGLALWERVSGDFVGAAGLHARSEDASCREVGYWIRTPCAGRGYASEAVRAIGRAACAALHLARIEIRASARNRASHRVAERAGFDLQGVVVDGRVDPDGQASATHVYVLRCGTREADARGPEEHVAATHRG